MRPENPSMTWFWNDWDVDSSKLSRAERGMLIDVIGLCATGPVLGEWCGPVGALMCYGETLKSTWGTLAAMGSKGAMPLEVKMRGEWVAVTAENYEVWSEIELMELTPIRLTWGRLVKLRERRESEAERQRKSRAKRSGKAEEKRGEKEGKCDKDVTEARQERDKDVTEARQERDKDVTRAKMKCGLTRARVSPISITKVIEEDAVSESEEIEGAAVEPEEAGRGRRVTEVDGAFLDEMEGLYGPMGIDVRREAVLAEAWIDGKKGRKFTRRFFQHTWLKREARSVAAVGGRRVSFSGEPTGERMVEEFDGRIE